MSKPELTCGTYPGAQPPPKMWSLFDGWDKTPGSFCAICEGGKVVPETHFEMSHMWDTTHPQGRVVLTGRDRPCPGCAGTGISTRAAIFRKDLMRRVVGISTDSYKVSHG